MSVVCCRVEKAIEGQGLDDLESSVVVSGLVTLDKTAECKSSAIQSILFLTVVKLTVKQ